MPGPGLYRALFVLRGNLPAGGFCAPHAAWALGRNGKKLAASGKTLAASWRSGWDSNPRAVSCKLISSHSALLERVGIYQNAEEATTGKNS